ncbi:MAG: hypothetical protein R3F43_20410 [bacterium]
MRKSATFDTIGGPAMMVAMAWPIVGALANGAGALFAGCSPASSSSSRRP